MDKWKFITIIIGVTSLIAAILVVPEFRVYAGLDKDKSLFDISNSVCNLINNQEFEQFNYILSDSTIFLNGKYYKRKKIVNNLTRAFIPKYNRFNCGIIGVYKLPLNSRFSHDLINHNESFIQSNRPDNKPINLNNSLEEHVEWNEHLKKKIGLVDGDIISLGTVLRHNEVRTSHEILVIRFDSIGQKVRSIFVL